LSPSSQVSSLTAEELVERCRASDHAAFRELFRRHRTDVARLVQRMLGPSADIEDVVQEVFLQVYRSIEDFRGAARFSTWLYRVTVNVVLMHRRAARSRPVLVEERPGFAPSDGAALPDEEVAKRARIEALYRLLERLTEKKRTVFILHDIQGMTPAEISRLVGAPVLTVRTRLFYARRELSALLGEEPALRSFASELAREERGPNAREPAHAEPVNRRQSKEETV
jgi:RNA polymerase sigma-70 factor (ECF subfamily)